MMSDKNKQYPNEDYPWPNHPAYGYPPHPNAYHHMPPPGYYPPPPPGYCPPPGYHPYYGHHGHPQPEQHLHHGKPHYEPPENDALYQQAEGVVEGLMGEQSGAFKETLSKMGIDDKEFWKGAMIGAAAALILGNENVRSNLMQMFTGAGDLLKSGGEKVKETASQTGSSIKENALKTGASVKKSVSTGNEIFKDTLSAGKQGFKASRERHQGDSELAEQALQEEVDLTADVELNSETEDKQDDK